MKSKQIKNVVIVAALLTVSSFAISQERLNGREAIEVCKNEISDTYASEREIRFSRNTASSLKAGAYKFWMNATEDDNGVISSVRYQCEITRNGELVGLTREAGRWNIYEIRGKNYLKKDLPPNLIDKMKVCCMQNNETFVHQKSIASGGYRWFSRPI